MCIFPELSQLKIFEVQRISFLGLSVLSGLLLFFAWNPLSFTFCIFFAWVPLLFLADKIQHKKSFIGYAFLALIIWNACTTWWIWNSTDIGSVFAIAFNSTIMLMPWYGFFITKKKQGNFVGYFALIAFWLLFEFIHLNWELSFPWLSLGNAFADKVNWVQWYEFTGVAGGSLWILLVNIVAYELFKNWKSKNSKWRTKIIVVIVCIISVPLIISNFLLHRISKEQNFDSNVVIVQPNIDPYQKFTYNTIAKQIEKLIALSENKIDSQTKWVIWPETALSAQIGVNDISNALIYKPVFDFVNRHPQITLLTGIETFKLMNEPTTYTQKTQDGLFYESYNAAVTINNKGVSPLYIKSKLVPGVEILPSFLKILAPLFEQFGGTTGGYAKDSSSKVFNTENNPYVVAPVICFESVYGEYVTSYIKKGANIIAIITNDGWWGNTAGHKQHLAYAKLRAIETRRWVVRSANTGISAVIDNTGKMLSTKEWDIADAIKYNVSPSNTITFYVQYGDYLYKIFSVFGLLMIGWNLITTCKKCRKKAEDNKKKV